MFDDDDYRPKTKGFNFAKYEEDIDTFDVEIITKGRKSYWYKVGETYKVFEVSNVTKDFLKDNIEKKYFVVTDDSQYTGLMIDKKDCNRL